MKNRITETIKVVREGNKANYTITTVDLMRTNFGLSRGLLGRILWNAVLWDGEKRGPRELVVFFS